MEDAEPPAPDLPADVVINIVLRTALPDVLSAAQTCRAWRAGVEAAWRPLAARRWPRGAAPPPLADAPAGDWRAYAAARHETDGRALAALRAAALPWELDGCLATLRAAGADAADALERAATWSDPRCLGLRHWAAVALRLLTADLECRRISAAVKQRQQASAIFDAALIIAQVHHPLADMDRLRGLVSDLSAELARRMRERGVPPRSRAALDALSELLLGEEPAAEDCGASGPAAAAPGPDAAARPARGPEGSGHGGAAAGEEEEEDDERGLYGPDLSGLRVPRGAGGLALRGDRDAYYAKANSLLDCVLARRRGLPLSLAVLYSAVGRGAGLDVQVVGLPAHVVARAEVDQPGGGSEPLWVDVFDGGRVMHAGAIRAFVQRLAPGSAFGDGWFAAAQPSAIVGRMLANLVNAAERGGIFQRRDPSPVQGAELDTWTLYAALCFLDVPELFSSSLAMRMLVLAGSLRVTDPRRTAHQPSWAASQGAEAPDSRLSEMRAACGSQTRRPGVRVCIGDIVRLPGRPTTPVGVCAGWRYADEPDKQVTDCCLVVTTTAEIRWLEGDEHVQVIGRTAKQPADKGTGGDAAPSSGGGGGGSGRAAAGIAAAEAGAVLRALEPPPRAALEAGRAAVRALGLRAAGLGSLFDGVPLALGEGSVGRGGLVPNALLRALFPCDTANC